MKRITEPAVFILCHNIEIFHCLHIKQRIVFRTLHFYVMKAVLFIALQFLYLTRHQGTGVSVRKRSCNCRIGLQYTGKIFRISPGKQFFRGNSQFLCIGVPYFMNQLFYHMWRQYYKAKFAANTYRIIKYQFSIPLSLSTSASLEKLRIDTNVMSNGTAVSTPA